MERKEVLEKGVPHNDVMIGYVEDFKILCRPEMRVVVSLDTESSFIKHFIRLAAFLNTGAGLASRFACTGREN